MENQPMTARAIKNSIKKEIVNTREAISAFLGMVKLIASTIVVG